MISINIEYEFGYKCRKKWVIENPIVVKCIL